MAAVKPAALREGLTPSQSWDMRWQGRFTELIHAGALCVEDAIEIIVIEALTTVEPFTT